MKEDGIIIQEKVGVIVPVYNRASVVTDTLDSIRSQTYRPLHLIVVDNNSSDNTYDVLNGWKAGNEASDFFISIVREPTPGAAAARQRGFEETDAERVIFFDSDDVMHKDMIASGMQVAKENPSVDIVYWRHVRETLDGNERVSHFTRHDLMECHLVHALLSTHAYIVRRDYFIKVGGWRPEIRVWDDFELGVRLLLGNPKYMGIDRVLYTVRSMEESITGTDFSSRAGRWEEVLDRIEDNIKASDSVETERWLRIVDYRRIILAAHYAREGRADIGETLRGEVKDNGRHNATRRFLLDLAYHYTRRGGRGAWILLHRFF